MLIVGQMARAIIRFSIDNESSNVTGNQIRDLLQDKGFDKIGTASFDTDGMDTASIVAVLRELLPILETPPGGGRLDHLWIYVDQPEPN